MIDVENQKTAETPRDGEELYRLLSSYYGRVIEVEIFSSHSGREAYFSRYDSSFNEKEIPAEERVESAIGRLASLGLVEASRVWLRKGQESSKTITVCIGEEKLVADSAEKIRVSVLDETLGSWKLIHSPISWSQTVAKAKTTIGELT